MSSSLIRQDLGPMVVGYVLIMSALAIGLRIVQRSGRAAPGDTAGAGAPASAGKAAGTGKAAGASEAARAGRAAGTAEATGAAGAAGSRRPAGPPAPAAAGQLTGRARLRAIAAPPPGWRRLAVYSLGTAVGGYLLLMAVIIAYYYGVTRVAGDFVDSAFSGCAMLIGLATPVFVALSWLAARKGWRI